jgi:hypothetical protein
MSSPLFERYAGGALQAGRWPHPSRKKIVPPSAGVKKKQGPDGVLKRGGRVEGEGLAAERV